MPKKDLFSFVICLMFLVTMVFLSSCRQNELAHQEGPGETSHEKALIARGVGHNGVFVSNALLNSTEDVTGRINMQEWYRSNLEQKGVHDLSTQSLVDKLNDKDPVIRIYSVLMLGERKEVSAMEQMEEKLQDESFPVRLSAAQALLKMDNRKGISVLKDYSDSVSVEVEAGNHRRLVNFYDALRVLADAGEVSAIPHLRKLQKYSGSDKGWLRLGAVRSLGKLHSKDRSVGKDIESMLNDEDPLVRKTSAGILRKIEANPEGTQ